MNMVKYAIIVAFLFYKATTGKQNPTHETCHQTKEVTFKFFADSFLVLNNISTHYACAKECALRTSCESWSFSVKVTRCQLYDVKPLVSANITSGSQYMFGLKTDFVSITKSI